MTLNIDNIDVSAHKLLKLVSSANVLLQSISSDELFKFSRQILVDIDKVNLGINNLRLEIEQFIKYTLPKIESEQSILEETLTQIRHNLRTPINAIQGYSELIVEELEEEKNQVSQKFTSMIKITSEMLQLIDSIKLANHSKKKVDYVIPAPTKTHHYKPPKISARVGSILVVDDIEENRALLHDWLTRRGYLVTIASDGKEALSYLKTNKNVDIVLLDIMMPEMDGFEVLYRMKSDPDIAGIIVIMISALEEMENIVQCIKGGADDYLVKPFNSYLLDARISSCLEKKRLRDSEKAYLLSLQEELSIAQKIQNSMLPIRIPTSDHYSIYGRTVPAKEVGGDFYDWYELGYNKIGFCVGDVSGKGISAALFMAVSSTVLNTLVKVQTSPAQSMMEANALLLRNNESMMFVTLFYGILDIKTGEVTFVNAGHWHPLIIKKSGEIIALEGSSGPALGVIEEVHYLQFNTFIEEGDTLFLYTDGITEAVDSGYTEFGLEGLKQTLNTYHHQSAKNLVEKVIHNVIKYTAEEDIFDDITCLALRLTKKESE